MNKLLIMTGAAAAALCANADDFYWRGTTENSIWDLTTANWSLNGSPAAFHNNANASVAHFDGQGATDVSVQSGGVTAYAINVDDGNHTLLGGTVTADTTEMNGGSLAIGAGGYLGTTFRPTSQSTLASRLTILTNGTLRAGFDKTAISSYAATLYFNGGMLLHTYDTYKNKVTFGKSKIVLGAGGMHVKERVANGWTYMPGPIGTDADLPADGGLIVDNLSSSTYVYMQGFDNATYRGGLHIAGSGGAIGIDADKVLGAVPATPTDNIFFDCPSNTVSSKFVAHGSVTVNSNRNIRIGNGVSAQIGTYANNSPLTIKGTISCENPEHGFVLTRHNGSAGTVTFDPGSGRTNHISRLSVGIPTVLASGTTLLYSTKGLGTSNEEKYGTNNGSPLHVASTMTVKSGAELKTVAGDRIITQNGNLIIDGGLVDFDGHEMLHAHAAAATTTVRNGGRLHVSKVRIGGDAAASDASKSVFNIETGGVVRLKGSLYIYDSQQTYKATVNFNGGAIEWAKPAVPGSQYANYPYGNDNTATRDNVAYNVLKGGMNITNDVAMWFYPSIKSGVSVGDTDGGLTKWGANTLAIMRSGHTFNGPLTAMQGTLSLGMNNPLPSTLTARVNAGASFDMNTYSQTFARIEGSGRFRGISSTAVLSVTSAIAPGMGADSLGTLTTSAAIDIADNVALEIDVDSAGNSDRLNYPATIDLSKMTLHVNDTTKLNKAMKYTIATLPGGIANGALFKSTNLPSDWAVRYYASTHELKIVPQKGFILSVL